LTVRQLCSGRTACHGSRVVPSRGRSNCNPLCLRQIEHDGEDTRNLPFLDRKAALARLLRDTEACILFNEHIAEDGPIVFAHACRLGAEGIVAKKVDGAYQSGPCRVWIKVIRNGTTAADVGLLRSAA
jgi:ATP-dependent DNA ligase